MTNRLLLVALCAQLLPSCVSTFPFKSSKSSAANEMASDEKDLADSIVSPGDTLNMLSMEELRALERGEEEFLNKSLNLADHEEKAEVQKWIEFFSKKDRKRFHYYLTNGTYYKPLIQTILKKQGIPTYFYYLALIESGFKHTAFSNAGAAGVWQFMPSTGRRYGLRVTNEVDERRDPIRATIAAAKYLNDLNNVFQSWFLAMGAYNAGEMRILGAIMSSGTRDFWALARKKYLPKETREYIPKFIAAAIIGNHPERYGFTDVENRAMPEMVSVVVSSPVNLKEVARLSSVPLEKIMQHNPHLRAEQTPSSTSHYRLWFEKNAALQIDNLAQLSPGNSNRRHHPPEVRLASQGPRSKEAKNANHQSSTAQYYQIKRGDTLYSIARKFKLSLVELKKINRISKNKRLVPGKKIVISAAS